MMRQNILLALLGVILILGCTSSRHNLVKESEQLQRSIPEKWRTVPAVILRDKHNWEYRIDNYGKPQAILERSVIIRFNRRIEFKRKLDIPFNSEILELNVDLIRNREIVPAEAKLMKDQSYSAISDKSRVTVHKKEMVLSSQPGDILALHFRTKLNYFPINLTWMLDDVLPKLKTSFSLTLPKQLPKGSKYDFYIMDRYNLNITKFYQKTYPANPDEYYFGYSDPAYIKAINLKESDFSYYFVNEPRVDPEINVYNSTNLIEIKWEVDFIKSKLDSYQPGKFVLLALKKIQNWHILGKTIAELYFPVRIPQTDLQLFAGYALEDGVSPEILLNRLSDIARGKIKILEAPLSVKWLRPIRFSDIQEIGYAFPQDLIFFFASILRYKGFKPFIGIVSLPYAPPFQTDFLAFQGNRMLLGVKDGPQTLWYDPLEGVIHPETDSEIYRRNTRVFRVSMEGFWEFTTLFPGKE